MDRDAVMSWIAGYERAWRANDPDGVDTLFTPDAIYRRSPYQPPEVGHGEIRAIWCEENDEVFTVQAEPVAVEGMTGVVRLVVRYGEPLRQEYTDLWVLHFAPDGRVAEFEEWPFAPGQPYTAEAPGSADEN